MCIRKFPSKPGACLKFEFARSRIGIAPPLGSADRWASLESTPPRGTPVSRAGFDRPRQDLENFSFQFCSVHSKLLPSPFPSLISGGEEEVSWGILLVS